MKCPICGEAELIHEIRNLPYTYKGQTTLIPNVTADWCDACGESITGPEESERVMTAMKEFNKSVNATFTDPTFVAAVRKKLRLDQREAGALFGGGTNAFSRYETGKTKPPLSLVKLLRLLDRHPELLDEVRTS